jgi:hypothetical protein
MRRIRIEWVDEGCSVVVEVVISFRDTGARFAFSNASCVCKCKNNKKNRQAKRANQKPGGRVHEED